MIHPAPSSTCPGFNGFTGRPFDADVSLTVEVGLWIHDLSVEDGEVAVRRRCGRGKYEEFRYRKCRHSVFCRCGDFYLFVNFFNTNNCSIFLAFFVVRILRALNEVQGSSYLLLELRQVDRCAGFGSLSSDFIYSPISPR